MPQFLDLPRELRDAIYTAIITWEQPRLSREDTQMTSGWTRICEPSSVRHGEYGCAYSTKPIPTTCANLIICNRQINDEMTQAITRARKRGLLAARLDCLATNESFHAFSWRSIPLVKTISCAPKGRGRILLEWADRLMVRYLDRPRTYGNFTTTIEGLWVDVRLSGGRSAKWDSNECPPDRTSWAVCAALKHFFDQDGLLSPVGGSSNKIIVDELTLNVVSPDRPPQEYIPEDFPLDGTHEGIVHPYTVARELVEVWHKVWLGEEFRAVYHHKLLEHIRRVRVSVDGAVWRVRELKLELERGQAEQRRIAARGVW